MSGRGQICGAFVDLRFVRSNCGLSHDVLTDKTCPGQTDGHTLASLLRIPQTFDEIRLKRSRNECVPHFRNAREVLARRVGAAVCFTDGSALVDK